MLAQEYIYMWGKSGKSKGGGEGVADTDGKE